MTIENPQLQPTVDMVNHPPHYNKHPSGIEVIDMIEGMDFCLGNTVNILCALNIKVIKYKIWKKLYGISTEKYQL